MRFKGDSVFSLCLLLFTAVLVFLCFSYNPTARLIPLVLGLLGLLLLSVQLLLEISPAGSKNLMFLKDKGDIFSVQGKAQFYPSQTSTFVKINWLQVLRIFTWLAVFVFFLYITYPLVVIPLFIFFFLSVEGRENWRRSLGLAAGTGVFMYLLFSLLLGIF
jgi:hypothetical protein